jgi:pyruvate dehydrogenase E1 component
MASAAAIRAMLRRFFEVDRQQIAVAALHLLATRGTISIRTVPSALDRYSLDAQAVAPWLT